MRAQPAPRSPLPRAALSEFENEAADGADDLTIDRDRDTVQSEAPIVMLPLHGSADPYPARYETYPEDRKDRIRTAMGITLLAIAGLGLGLWGYWLFETSADPNAPAAVAQRASQPAPAPESAPPAAVVPDPTANSTPTAPAPQVPARQAASTATTTPAPDASKTAPPVAPPAPVRPVAPPAPVTPAAPPAAPRAVSPDRAAQAPQRQSPPVATVPPASSVGSPAAAAPRSERPATPPPSQQAAVSAASTGGLFAITRPIGAQVFLDDKLIGTTPLFLSGVAEGRHAIRLELSGYKPYASSIDIKPNERFRVAAQLEQ